MGRPPLFPRQFVPFFCVHPHLCLRCTTRPKFLPFDIVLPYRFAATRAPFPPSSIARFRRFDLQAGLHFRNWIFYSRKFTNAFCYCFPFLPRTPRPRLGLVTLLPSPLQGPCNLRESEFIQIRPSGSCLTATQLCPLSCPFRALLVISHRTFLERVLSISYVRFTTIRLFTKVWSEKNCPFFLIQSSRVSFVVSPASVPRSMRSTMSTKASASHRGPISNS